MMITYEKVNDREYELWEDDEKIGYLEWDQRQEAWVFWNTATDDGTTYFDDLEETVEQINDEVMIWQEENN